MGVGFGVCCIIFVCGVSIVFIRVIVDDVVDDDVVG